jgi:hypothetical protein
MDYARAVALAQRLIEANGRDTVLQRLDATPADADMPWKGPGTPTVAAEYERVGVFLPHNGTEDLGRYLFDSELLKRCDQVALIAGGDDDLSVCNQLNDSGKKWRITWIRELKPGDTTVLYAIGVAQ